jgi:AbrB family looped-hinge helix DNA binding protein
MITLTSMSKNPDVLTMKITTKGQVTIPLAVRERHGLLPGTEVQFVDDGEQVTLRKAPGSARRGSRLVDHLRGRATTSMTTDQIMALCRGDD